MASIGLSKPHIAKYAAEDGKVTYSDGVVAGKATELSLSLNGQSQSVLYADNGPAESESVFDGGTITLGTDELRPEAVMAMYAPEEEEITNEAVKTEGAKWMKYNDNQTVPYLGFGAIAKRKIDGKVKWVAVIYPKIQFQHFGEDLVNQGESIEWKTPKVTAELLKDDTKDHEWRRISTPLDTEEEAEAIVKAFLNITA